MSRLTDLIKQFKDEDRKNVKERTVLVLEMVQYALTYPPLGDITEKEQSSIYRCICELAKDLDDKVFAARLKKMWKRRKHLLQIAENAHEVSRDYMDNLEYHEEIAWLVEERENRQRK
ncbi:MAG: hypothetical protein ACFFAZ_13430 [Promethearchaeota archaeon]